MSEKEEKKEDKRAKGYANLKPCSKLSPEEHKAISSKGGINSGISKRKKRDMREQMKCLLELTYSKDKANEILEGNIDLLEGDYSVSNVLNLKMIQEAAEGNGKAYEIVRDTAGYKPAEQVQMVADIMTDQDRSLLGKVAKRTGIDPKE